MKRNKPRKRSDTWFTTTEAARVFGMTPEGFRRSVAPLAPEPARRNTKAGSEWNLPQVLDAWVQDQVERRSGPDAAALAGGNSPALERLRHLMIEEKKLTLAERRAQLLDRSEMHGQLGRIAARLRRSLDTLQRRCGHVAHEILSSALDEAEIEIERTFARTTDGGSAAESPGRAKRRRATAPQNAT